jgi:hypothetical protein
VDHEKAKLEIHAVAFATAVLTLTVATWLAAAAGGLGLTGGFAYGSTAAKSSLRPLPQGLATPMTISFPT